MEFRKIKFAMLALVASLALVLSACGDDDEDPGTAGSGTAGQTTSTAGSGT